MSPTTATKIHRNRHLHKGHQPLNPVRLAAAPFPEDKSRWAGSTGRVDHPGHQDCGTPHRPSPSPPPPPQSPLRRPPPPRQPHRPSVPRFPTPPLLLNRCRRDGSSTSQKCSPRTEWRGCRCSCCCRRRRHCRRVDAEAVVGARGGDEKVKFGTISARAVRRYTLRFWGRFAPTPTCRIHCLWLGRDRVLRLPLEPTKKKKRPIY